MNRRRFLRLAGLVAGGSLAGCVGADDWRSFSATRTTTATPLDGLDGGGWPTFGHDRANTGHAPGASGPTDDAEVVWTFDAGSPPAPSPVVVGDVVFTGSSETNGDLRALDAASGERFWSFDTDGWVNHAPTFADGAVYVGTDDRRFHAVDARTGERRWTADLDRDLRDSSPTVADGTVYVGTAGSAPTTASPTGGSSMTASPADNASATASPGEESTAGVVGDDATATASGEGTATASGNEQGAASGADGADRRGGLVALDAATGAVRWTFEVGDWISTTPAVADGRVYFGDDTGRVRALDAATGEERWSYETGTGVDSSPAVADGTVYLGAGGTLFALDAASGQARWTFDLRWSGVNASPAIADGTVYVACRGGGCRDAEATDQSCDPPNRTARLYAVDAGLGAERWHYDVGRDVRSAPAVADGTVYVGRAGGVSAVDAEDGSEAWRVDLGSDADSSPAVAGGRVFVDCADGTVYALGRSATR